ncbi:hypothetical protein D9757_003422 [Collybiopsis confluens]|uniref:NAD(P)-binding domain-containing protein n=1 Tax=Collybiopsis confluens TaxID=2823264 RepID=A0A8H5HTN0_9AGAR|nr:hypothetical protein D9757_003422 [Collybiopsis confluens]
MNVLAIGASKNIGYFASLRLLGEVVQRIPSQDAPNFLMILSDAGCTVTFMLRSPSVFDSDGAIQAHVRSGKAHLIKGDALALSDVKEGWSSALGHGPVDAVLFTVGGKPDFKLTKGFVTKPANLCTQGILNVLCSLPQQPSPPKIVTFSSTGVTKASHDTLPTPLKMVYSMITVPHRDKLGVERVVSHCGGWKWDTKGDGELPEFILEKGWKETEGLPAAGTFKNILLIRPGFLTDGECLADDKGEGAYRVVEGDVRGWTVSRKDVGHFVADAVLNRWNEYANKCVTVVY